MTWNTDFTDCPKGRPVLVKGYGDWSVRNIEESSENYGVWVAEYNEYMSFDEDCQAVSGFTSVTHNPYHDNISLIVWMEIPE